MKLRSRARTFYITVVILLIATTLAALYDGGYHMEGGAIAGIAGASIITSFLPFFISMHLFKKHALNTNGNGYFKVWGAVIYFFCFPVKSLIIYLNLALLITGGDGWSLG